MKLKNGQYWIDCNRENGNCDYGKPILIFVEEWADSIEESIDEGERLEDVAEKLKPKMGLSGEQYGIAIETLSKVWVHGESLRVWHNTNFGNPDTDGVVNPYQVTI